MGLLVWKLGRHLLFFRRTEVAAFRRLFIGKFPKRE